jgi:hypothetical protein
VGLTCFRLIAVLLDARSKMPATFAGKEARIETMWTDRKERELWSELWRGGNRGMRPYDGEKVAFGFADPHLTSLKLFERAS